MKRYKLYVKLNDHNEAILKDRYTHYAEAADAQRLIKAANDIPTRCVLYDTFTGKIIYEK